MNIVYFLSSFPQLSESFVLNEIFELDQNGHDVAVFAIHQPDSDIVHEEFDELDVPIHYTGKYSILDLPNLLSSKVFSPQILRRMHYRAPIDVHIGNLLRARDCIDFVDSLGWDPDHVHTHFSKPSNIAALYAAKYYEVPFTITTHAADIYSKPIQPSTGYLLKNATRIITISEYNKEYIRNQFAPATPIEVVRAGIRPDKFIPTDKTESTRVLTISRLVEKKGLITALEAIYKATDEIPDIKYHIIGSGDLKQNLIRKVDELDLKGNVEFLDNVTDQRLITELDEARCFLLPCRITETGDRDGIPVVLMEAMAMKTPPVSTTVSGIPELINHGRNGVLTEPQDPEATAEAVVTLLEDPAEWEKYADRAREKVIADFNIENEAKKLEVLFRNASAEKKEVSQYA